jgi:hypothetical protein
MSLLPHSCPLAWTLLVPLLLQVLLLVVVVVMVFAWLLSREQLVSVRALHGWHLCSDLLIASEGASE